VIPPDSCRLWAQPQTPVLDRESAKLATLPSAGLTAANPPHAKAAAQDGTDRQTERQTPDRFTHPASSVKNSAEQEKLAVQ